VTGVRASVARMRAVLLSERALAPTDRLFADAIAHLSRKLGRVKPLDPASLPADRAGALAVLEAWAGDEVTTWEGELSRFYEEHLPLHTRPRPGLNAVVRALAADGVAVAAWSPGPAAAFDLLIAHLGLSRSLACVRIDSSAGAPAALAADLRLPADECVAVTDEDGPAATAREAGMRVLADAGELTQLVV
jgi:beta-phosphoglucomutase-like phosphatase (HAD superfamily)